MFSFFSSTSITEFSLSYDYDTHDRLYPEQSEDLKKFFTSVAGQLRSLLMWPIFPSNIPTFIGCTNLKSLSIDCESDGLDEIIRILPSKLDHVSLNMRENDGCTVVKLLELPSLENLSCFQLLAAEDSREMFMSWEEGPALVAELERRNIRILYGNGECTFFFFFCLFRGSQNVQNKSTSFLASDPVGHGQSSYIYDQDALKI